MFKTFKSYLEESAKTYSFKIKVAGPLPDDFQKTVKQALGKFSAKKIKLTTTPIQECPLDFPEIKNVEVNIIDLDLAYPATPPELAAYFKDLGICEKNVKIRYADEPWHDENYAKLVNPDQEEPASSLLRDPDYKECAEVKADTLFGDKFNLSLLKELEKVAKNRQKEAGHGSLHEYEIPTQETSNTGLKSPIGSEK